MESRLQGHRYGIASGRDVAERRNIAMAARLLFHYELEHRGHSKNVSAMESLDQIERSRGLEGPEHDCRRALL